MVSRRRAGQSCPDLLKPLTMIIRRDNTENSSCYTRRTVSAWFPFHQYELNVILDYRIWLVRLAKKSRSIIRFIRRIGNLVPNDGSEIVKSDLAAALLYGRMKRHHRVTPAIFASGKTDIPHDANEATPWNQDAKTLAPDLIQFGQKSLIIRHVPKLTRYFRVFFEIPVGR